MVGPGRVRDRLGGNRQSDGGVFGADLGVK